MYRIAALFAIFLSSVPMIGHAGEPKRFTCDISERQKESVRALLCGSSTNFENQCFMQNFKQKYASYTQQMRVLRRCGYLADAVSWEAALKKFGQILRPMGICVRDEPDLSKLFDDVSNEQSNVIVATCSAADRIFIQKRLPEINQMVDALKNPDVVSIRLYKNLGFIKE